MELDLARPKKARCCLLYAMAPKGFNPARANEAVNTLISRKDTPLCVYHDHFIGQAGGLAVFDIRDLAEIDALAKACAEELDGWSVDIRPLIFSHNPAAFDEQIRYTLKSYGGVEWDDLKRENRPVYADPQAEAQKAED